MINVKEKLEKKIAEIVDYIVNKPASEVTLDDYTVLQNELKEIAIRDSQADHNKRMADILAVVSGSGFNGNVN